MVHEATRNRVASLKQQFASKKEVNPFSWMVEEVCGVTFVDKPRDDPFRGNNRPSDLRIALVSLPEFAWELQEFSSLRSPDDRPPGADPRAFHRALATLQADAAARMFEVFRDAMESAYDSFQPHVICFNELGLPSDNMVPMPQAKALASQMSREKNLLIVAGTGHDARSLYNTGYIFRPGGPEDGECFHKTVSARSVGELISAPASRRVAAVRFAGLRIAIMVCLDIADYASIASVVKVGDGVDVLLVPCYTPKFDDMASLAKVASKALPGVVALVNADLPDHSAKCCQIAQFGHLVKASDCKPLASGAQISLLKINIANFETTRTDLKTSADGEMDEMEYLFGRRDMPSAP